MNFLNQNINNPLSIDAAIHALCSSEQIEELDYGTINAIHVLVQASLKKQAVKIKPLDNPFKLASLFLADKKDDRDYLRYIYSTGEYLMASNGRILIKINHKCNTGYYDTFGNLTDYTHKYPDLNNKLQSFENGDSVDIDDNEIESKDAKTKLNRFKQCTVNNKYLNILKKISIKTVTESEQGLYFKSEDGYFSGVVCPMQK